jgi:hypothetical protein
MDKGVRPVPIEVDTPRSPGWWMKRLFNMLNDPRRASRLQLLHDYHTGHAPLPDGAHNAREAFESFQRKARSNFAELIVSAVSERLSVDGFRTALDEDESGDAEMGVLWQRAGMDVESTEVHDMMLALSEAYVIVGPVDEDTGAPTVSAEDPRFMVAETVPGKRNKIAAALKVLYDDAEGETRGYLYLPGQILVARYKHIPWILEPTGPYKPVTAFNPKAWEWDTERSGVLEHDRIPVVRFVNQHGAGEYEAHTDLLDRINHQILQRMVIATLQAFKQRAVKGLPLKDAQGKLIDYRDVFTMDPAALWQLPDTADMWESGQTDLRPILMAVKDDVQHLAAATRTPMHMLMPSGENQSAEGATMQREGLVFKTKDRITRVKYPWAQVASLMLLHAGQSERADLAKLAMIPAPPEHLSLTERANAAALAAQDMPRRTRLIRIWGMSPAEADRVMSEWADDQLLAQQVAAATVAGQVGQTPRTPAPAAAGPAAPLPGATEFPALTAPTNPPVGAEQP